MKGIGGRPSTAAATRVAAAQGVAPLREDGARRGRRTRTRSEGDLVCVIMH